MSIILNRRGSGSIHLESTGFASESELQEYIAANPTCIPMEEIEEGLRLVVLGREFQTNSGPVDVLAMDSEGRLYVIETKLYNNADKRRVVAQALDYGAALWASGGDAVLTAVESLVAKTGTTLSNRIREVLGTSEEHALDAVNALKANLTNGKFRFVVLMDEVHERLKDLILFLNENSKFEVLAVELEVYRHDDLQIVIPRVFGAQTRKGASESRKWDELSFRRRLPELPLAPKYVDVLEWALGVGRRMETDGLGRVTFGSGNRPQTMVRTDGNTVFLAGVSKGSQTAHINLPMMEWKGDPPTIEAALRELAAALGTDIPFDPTVFRYPIQDALLAQANRGAVERALRALAVALT